MDSSSSDCSPNADRQAAAADGDDLISGLADDVLLHILALVSDATDAARMAALSRRWLRLWARVPALHFACRLPTTTPATAAALELERYVSFVHDVLTRRTQSGSGSAVESLSISCAMGFQHLEQLMPALIHAAQGWIRHAVAVSQSQSQHDGLLKRFVLDLDCRDANEYHDKGWKKNPDLVLHLLDDDDDDDLPPRSLLLESMRLALGGARLRLPATAAMDFAWLRDLSLERIRITDGGGHLLLARLVSSASCPCLQKLRLIKVWFCSPDDDFHFNGGGEEMRLQVEADVLSELWMEELYSASLQLTTPSLRLLHIHRCCFYKAMRISAPRLQQLALFFHLGCPPPCLEIHHHDDLLRRLKLCVWSHRGHDSKWGDAENKSNTLLLNHYSSVACLDVTLDGRKVFEDDVDLIESKIPHLPHITSLTVNVSLSFERHDFGAGVASLLTRFSNLRHLSLHLPFFLSLHYGLKAGLGLECNHQNYWTSHEISMDHLEEVELSGLTGTDCELWLMKALLASAKGLRKVAISFNSKCWQHQCKMDAFKRMLLDEGMQTSHSDTFMLHARMNL